MARVQTLTFTNKTGLCSSKKKLFLTFLTCCLFLAIVGICAYQIGYGPSGVTWLPPESIKGDDDFRLPKNLVPTLYKLHLIPHLSPAETFRIDGKTEIWFQCVENTSRVVLNLKNMTLREVKVHVLDGPEGNVTGALDVISQEFDPSRDFYTAKVNETLEVGGYYKILIDYEGTLNDELVGFYRSSYVDKSTNETRWMGVTQFSPTDARRAFPAFDEPAFKAQFEVSLGRTENMTSISNMNLLKSEPMGGEMSGWVMDHYARSLKMSTYLVGFAVSDFARRLSNETLGTTKFQVWARADAIDQTGYAGNIGPRILTYFEQYFGIQFPMPKLDMIGVPEHRFNAMENWGLITYRELAILFDAKYSSDANKRRIAEVVSHELGHQWFGNLVTPAWWSDLWLKEGFASYLMYIGVDYVEPEWEMLNIFVLNEVQNVFRLDALNNSHPVSIPVGHPNEINRIFDDISYSKGCTIIRMMDHFLTSATFKKGITNYLNKWQFNNTEQSDLWEELTLQGHADGTLHPALSAAEIMDTWTLQKGFPVLTVVRNYENSNSTTFVQNKFSLIPQYEGSGYRWHIPVSIVNASAPDFNATTPTFWLFKNQTEAVQNLENDPNDWLIANVQTSGYYRVNYDQSNWILLTRQMLDAPEVIHVVNRGQLLDDALTLARASLLTYDLALNLTLYISSEREFLPWESYLHNVEFLLNMALDQPADEQLQAYVLSLLTSEFERIGFEEPMEGETVLQRAHRISILKSACGLEYSNCTEKALEAFSTWMDEGLEGNPIPVNLRPVVYCTGIRFGNESAWEFTKQKYLEVNVASEKDRILTALACSRNVTILNRYIEDAVTPNSYVRKQDSRNVLQRVASASSIGNRLVFEFILKEWPRIREYFGAGLSLRKLINDGVAQKLKTASDLAALEKFKVDYAGTFGDGETAVDEAIEIVRTNLHWMETSYQAVVNWLQAYQDGPPNI